MNESLSKGCAKIFREVSGLEESSIYCDWSDERLLNEPLESFDIDSLALLEFIMNVETAYNVELDEEQVNRCRKIADIVALVVASHDGPN
jgi:acyl carrier protein